MLVTVHYGGYKYGLYWRGRGGGGDYKIMNLDITSVSVCLKCTRTLLENNN